MIKSIGNAAIPATLNSTLQYGIFLSNTIAAGHFEQIHKVGGVGLGNTLLLVIGKMTIEGLNLALTTQVT